MRLRRVLAAVVLAAGFTWLAVVGLAWSRTRLAGPEPTIQLRDRHGAFLAEVGEGADERLGYWPVPTLPERVVAATLAIEDHRFASHPGVDPIAVARALWQNASSGRRVSGGSTLAMQVARLQDPGPRTVPRKALEALTALLLVDRHGREEVLRQYLVLAPYGNNVHGIAYAARRYFDKPVEDLSWAETALLAGIPQAPGEMDLYTAKGRARASSRAVRILDRLAADGALDEVEHATAVRELARLRPGERPIRPTTSLHPVLALERVIVADREPWRRTPIVRTSLDLELQADVQHLLRVAVDGWAARGAGNAAAVVVDLQTMQVLADVGSVGWYDVERRGAIDFSRTPRYPGSTLKPFLYAEAMEEGLMGPGTVLDDLERGPDGIGNADGRFLGPLLPRRALANSRNVPTVRLTNELGLDRAFGLLAELGLHDGALPAEHYGLGLAIGGMPTTLLELTRAWGALATDGRLRDLQWTADAVRPDGRGQFDPGVASWVGLALSDPMARLPTFPRMGNGELPFAAAIKTGTSPDHRDAWAMAYTRRYLVGVWIGHPDWRPMDGLSGYTAGSHLARQIALRLHPDEADGLSDVGFAPPPGWRSARVCPMSGHLAGESCTGAFEEWFAPGQAPVDPCAVHRVEGGRVVVDLPARYAAWQAEEGLPTPARPPRSDAPVTLTLLSPADGTRVVADPESPPGRSTIELAVAVDPPVDEVLWVVDGAPYRVVAAPYATRWPLAPGTHTFEARLPWRPERSGSATVVSH